MSPVPFRSTNRQAPLVSLREALLTGQAPDRGLYEPVAFPRLPAAALAAFRDQTYPEIARQVLAPYVEGILDLPTLRQMCEDAYDYAVPLERVGDAATSRVWVLRLDRGPTASFKDFAARLMARWMGHFVRAAHGRLCILTATSGDTGSAVAHAFHRVDGVQVLVAFPRDEVSEQQRRQMTTLGGNVRTVALEGKFDDCQALVKQAFADPALADLPLSSANSINIGRLLPQSVYYFYAASRVAAPGEPVVFVVPSGNFGNLMGGMVAWRMGLPVQRVVAPVNANDEFPRFLATGRYAKIAPSRDCLSNAMNVGHPSNLARLFSLYGGRMDETGQVLESPDLAALRRDLMSVSVSDAETVAALRQAWQEHRLLLEPHGAVGWRGYQAFRDGAGPAAMDLPVVVLETAHPAKFPEAIEAALGWKPEAPPALAGLEGRPEDYDRLPADYGAFRDYVVQRLR